MANPNITDRSNTTHYTSGLSVGTVITQPVTFADSTGAAVSQTVAAESTDLATVITLANSMRTQLIALGILTA